MRASIRLSLRSMRADVRVNMLLGDGCARKIRITERAAEPRKLCKYRNRKPKRIPLDITSTGVNFVNCHHAHEMEATNVRPRKW